MWAMIRGVEESKNEVPWVAEDLHDFLYIKISSANPNPVTFAFAKLQACLSYSRSIYA